MPVEVSFKKKAQGGRMMQVTVLSVEHQSEMKVLDLKKSVIAKMNESENAHNFRIFSEGELDVKSGVTLLNDSNPIGDGEKVDIIFQDLMSRLTSSLNDFAKTDMGKKAEEEWQKILKDGIPESPRDQGASSSGVQTAEGRDGIPESPRDQGASSSGVQTAEGRAVGLRKISIPTMYGSMEADAFLITYIQNKPHVTTYNGVYQVSKRFVQTHNVVILNQDEDEERVPSADEDMEDEVFVAEVENVNQSIPETTTQVPDVSVSEIAPSTAEPDDEPQGQFWMLKYVFPNKAEKEFAINPNVSIAVLKEIIMKDAGFKKEDVKKHTFQKGEDILANNRQKVKTALKDDDLVLVRSSLTGGGRAVKKDAKDETFKKFLLEEKKKAITVSAQMMNQMTFGDDIQTVMKDVKTKAESIYMTTQENPKLTMVKLLRGMSSDALKDLVNYNTNKSDLRATGICVKMMSANLANFAKMSKDFDNAKETVLQVFNMVFTANFFKNNTSWDWKNFEKLVEVEVGIKETAPTSASASAPTPAVETLSDTNMG
ncbi:unnamed protein product [Effrenium voratum]|uniref:Ubiquitin-like domain-containing protein n=1 Tax=Effrenium voratum TaxID=2562239 RepID=A0AA36IRM4_9DINO|nr:unnamed protein product [Effrenium voratum]